MPKETFDIVHHGTHVTIEPHFCREIDCFGTNPDHGYSFEDACEEVAKWHDMQAERWRSMTHEDAVAWLDQSPPN